ncbi:MAG TPA: hypothetical protein VMP01_27085 [Pirellulaceae bacterium]|nr:hypothetical protein [Pirellulaceae bacterium]
MFKFTIRELLLLTLVVAWYIDRGQRRPSGSDSARRKNVPRGN